MKLLMDPTTRDVFVFYYFHSILIRNHINCYEGKEGKMSLLWTRNPWHENGTAISALIPKIIRSNLPYFSFLELTRIQKSQDTQTLTQAGMITMTCAALETEAK